jgi:hypothetical protein
MEPLGSIFRKYPGYSPMQSIEEYLIEYQAAQRKVFGVRPNQRLQAR